jgi:hypothetical protein
VCTKRFPLRGKDDVATKTAIVVERTKTKFWKNTPETKTKSVVSKINDA